MRLCTGLLATALFAGCADSHHERCNEVPSRSIVNASPKAKLRVDDFVFLRPTQSEAVFLQFGDLLAIRGGRVVDRWPALSS